MNVFKEIFGRIWAAWGIVWFLVSMILIVLIPAAISYYIKEPKGSKFFLAVSRVWVSVFLYGVGCPMRVYGKENYDKNKLYVVTANHQSFLDVPLFCPFFPGPNKTIAKNTFSKIPIFNVIYNRGSVLVDRESEKSRRQSLHKMRDVLEKQQLNMALFPEGTRNRTGNPLKSFYDGAFRLARDAQKDVMPVVMLHTAYALPPQKTFFMQPHPVEMHILPAISSAGKTTKQLKEEAFAAMWEFIEKSNNKRLEEKPRVEIPSA